MRRALIISAICSIFIVLVFMTGLLIGCSQDKSLTSHQRELTIGHVLFWLDSEKLKAEAKEELMSWSDEQINYLGQGSIYRWYTKENFDKEMANGGIVRLKSGQLVNLSLFESPNATGVPSLLEYASAIAYVSKVKMYAISWDWSKSIKTHSEFERELMSLGASLEEANEVLAKWKKHQ